MRGDIAGLAGSVDNFGLPFGGDGSNVLKTEFMRYYEIARWKVWLTALICAASLPMRADSAQGEAELASANTAFAFDLFGQIAHEQPDANIFISPYSVSAVLQMIDNGAAGATKLEMERALHTDILPTNALNAACQSLNQSLKSQTNVVLELANAIWYKRGIRLKPGFIAANREFFQAELSAVEFDNAQSADIINDWASSNTHGKIQQVVSWPFPSATRLILANAIYFKGEWEIPFDKKETRPQAFHLPDSEKQVPMMWRHGRFAYQRGEDFQAVQLPYAGERLRMDVFLPDDNSTLTDLLSRFGAVSDRSRILTQFLEREGTLALPRFKLEFGVKLNDSLQALGIKRAFHNADFSAMSDEPLELSEVRQKSYISVDEEGTEAAAVTTGMMRATAVERPVRPFEMIVDRPFFFVIEDSQTQSVLFMGVVYDPKN